MRSDSACRGIQIGRYVANPTLLSLGVTSVNVQLTLSKHYRLWASVNAFFTFGTSSGTAATTSSHPLTAGLDALCATDATNIWIAGVVASGTGTLYISEVEANEG